MGSYKPQKNFDFYSEQDEESMEDFKLRIAHLSFSLII